MMKESEIKTVLFPGRGSEDDSEDDLHVETQILDAEHDIDKHDQWPQSQQQTSNIEKFEF